VRGALVPKLAVMFVLGLLQGLLGWYMVKSGLVDRPDVSPYRLTAHLGLAVIIYGYILWVAMGLLAERQPRPSAGRAGGGYRIARIFAPVLTGLVFVTILSGGFVAGLDAGFAYNSFPLMDGRFVPLDLLRLEPAWRNAFENLQLVQFDHRLLAKLTLLAAIGLVACSGAASARTALPAGARLALTLLLAMALIQFGLGVATLLLVMPISLAALHQAGALALFTFALWSCHELYRRVG
jgi:cytochrome c oxidase assembly protein subunit 15